MQEVWVVLGVTEFEGCELISIHGSRRKANDKAKKLNAKNTLACYRVEVRRHEVQDA